MGGSHEWSYRNFSDSSLIGAGTILIPVPLGVNLPLERPLHHPSETRSLLSVFAIPSSSTHQHATRAIRKAVIRPSINYRDERRPLVSISTCPRTALSTSPGLYFRSRLLPFSSLRIDVTPQALRSSSFPGIHAFRHLSAINSFGADGRQELP